MEVLSKSRPIHNPGRSAVKPKISMREINSVIAELSAQQKGSRTLSQVDYLVAMRQLASAGGLQTLEPLLPLSLALDGEPYNLLEHAPFSPMYRLTMPSQLLLKTGRQTGKCGRFVDGLIRKADGQQIGIAELHVGDRLLSLEDDCTFAGRRVLNIWEAGEKPVVRVKTRLGADIEITDEHRLRTLLGYKTVAELQIGDRLASVRAGGEWQNRPQPRERIILTAYMIGDGNCYTSGNWQMAAAAGPVLAEFQELASPLQPVELTTCHRGNANYSVRFSRYSQLATWLTADGLAGHYAWQKWVPAWVFALSSADTALFVSRLWATDGRVKTNKGSGACSPDISYSTTSRRLARDVRSLLNKFGIPASITRKKAGYRKKDGTYKRCRDAYIVQVETRQGWLDFFANFDVPGKPAVPISETIEKSNRDTIPREVNAWIAELCDATKWCHADSLLASGLRATPKYALSRPKLQQYITYFERVSPTHPRLMDLRKLRDGGVYWDEIVSIERLPATLCWDIEIETTENYVLDGIVSHNSTNLAAHGVMLSNCIPYFKTLFITPLYEQIRRFSNNYVRPFIDRSPIRSLWSGTNTENSVLQRSFKNLSTMLFSFALLDADRIRGISAHRVCLDELQDLDPDHIPIIRETMSHSPWGLMTMTGTPKSLDGPLEGSWLKSSQAEWFIPCRTPGCGEWNIPSLDHHIYQMLGPLHDSISEKVPGVVCHKCRKPINPRPLADGSGARWVHRYPERRHKFAGYHIPQLILPLHYARYDKWSELLAKQQGWGNTSKNVFCNEVLGESVDSGQKLVSQTELQRAAILPWVNTPNDPSPELIKRLKHYKQRILAVDWGGGGEDEVSFTALSLLGLTPDNKIDCLWGKRLVISTEHLQEAIECLHWLRTFGCELLVHDYTGAGIVRETVLVQAGFSLERVMPIQYVRAASRSLMKFIEPSILHNRGHYRLDKMRSLLYTCQAIKLQILRFFKYDHISDESPGLMHDFLALVEEKNHTRLAGDIYTITRNPLLTDDFAQATNIGCAALWHANDCWPDFAKAAGIARITRGQMQMAGHGGYGWTEDYTQHGFFNQP